MMVSFRQGRRRSWQNSPDRPLNDGLAGSSTSLCNADDISPISPSSSHELFSTAQRHDAVPRTDGGLPSAVDIVSPLEPDTNVSWTECCWSDATTASAVLSLLKKEPLSPPSNCTSEHGRAQSAARIACSVCFDVLEPGQYPECPISAECDHTSIPGAHICNVCLSRSLDIEFSASRTAALTCPLCHVQLSDEEVERWASTPTFLAYDIARTWQILEEDAEFVVCIRPDCGYGQLHAGGLEDPVVVCGACGTRTCFIHRNTAWHEGLTCAEYEATSHLGMSRENRLAGLPDVLRVGRPRNQNPVSEEFLSQRTIQETTRCCPRCQAATEKAGGCKYMKCGMCWQEWCWDCGIYWERGHLGIECSIFSNER